MDNKNKKINNKGKYILFFEVTVIVLVLSFSIWGFKELVYDKLLAKEENYTSSKIDDYLETSSISSSIDRREESTSKISTSIEVHSRTESTVSTKESTTTTESEITSDTSTSTTENILEESSIITFESSLESSKTVLAAMEEVSSEVEESSKNEQLEIENSSSDIYETTDDEADIVISFIENESETTTEITESISESLPEENTTEAGIVEDDGNSTKYKLNTSHNYEASSYAYDTAEIRGYVSRKVKYEGDEKVVFLTFDDGPDLNLTPRVLNTLQKYGVHGTFFILGKMASKEASGPILRRELEEGHAIGIHSYSHVYTYLYPRRRGNTERIMGELDKTLEILKSHLGEDFNTTLFRYPGGHMSWVGLEEADAQMKARNIEYIDWNVISGDAVKPEDIKAKQTAIQSIDHDMKMYKNPNMVVVLMHDIKPKSVNALPQIIEYFRDRGYKFGILE